MRFSSVVSLLFAAAAGQETPPLLPPNQTYVQTYDMQRSTIVMVCNYSGYQSVGNFAIEDYDWSNSLAAWSAATPMDTNERLLVQAGMARSSPNAPLAWIYRNSVYGYPWYNTVRFILDDPAYAPWFIKFAGPGPWVSPNCDNDYSPPLCTDYFHTQMDTPLPRDGGYGKCAPPACNCGSKPCGVRSRGARARIVSKATTYPPFPPNAAVLCIQSQFDRDCRKCILPAVVHRLLRAGQHWHEPRRCGFL